jgi:hypothetical protein
MARFALALGLAGTVIAAFLGVRAFAQADAPATPFHGIALAKACVSPTVVGNPYTCSYAVYNNIDNAPDTLTVSSMIDVVHANPSDVSSGEILPLVTFHFSGGASCNPGQTLCTLPPGSSMTSDPYTFYTADGDDPNPLDDDVFIVWHDLCDSGALNCPGAPLHADTGSSSYLITNTPTRTPVGTPTNTLTHTATNTVTPTSTLTHTATNTVTPTDTPTPSSTTTSTATGTATGVPSTATPTGTPTRTPTALPSTATPTTSTVTPTATVTPGGGGQGCTPGFWKNHADAGTYPLAWPLTPYSPNDDVETVFGVDLPPAYDTMNLLGALNAGGGGLNALLRHGVAALLNASHPDIAYDLEADGPGGVIDLFQQAIAAGPGAYETYKNIFAANNEAGCPTDGK